MVEEPTQEDEASSFLSDMKLNRFLKANGFRRVDGVGVFALFATQDRYADSPAGTDEWESRSFEVHENQEVIELEVKPDDGAMSFDIRSRAVQEYQQDPNRGHGQTNSASTACMSSRATAESVTDGDALPTSVYVRGITLSHGR